MIRLKNTEWFILIGLLFLSFVPSVGGTLRVIEMSTNSSFLPENPRLDETHVPMVFHIIGSVLFCILGIFQFLPTIRKAYPRWHRFLGRVFVVAGITAAVTGLWMTHFYDFSQQLQGELLYGVRIAVGFSMLASILWGLSGAINKNFITHQAWMIRAYALGQGAGMQVLTGILWSIFAQDATGFTRDLLMTASWVINIMIAEWVIRKIRLKRAVRTSIVKPAR